ncbi:MAG: hypothetical protein CMH49_07095, partial [Myxococcales bacterium]|nr:hypothetical protein [Myxococcales bacterium]
MHSRNKPKVMGSQESLDSKKTSYSTSNSKSKPELELNPEAFVLGEHHAYFSLNHFHIDGVKQGSLSHLTFRPNSGLHPIDSASFDHEKLHLNFDQSTKPINRKIKNQEILNLIEQVRHAQRNVVLGQEFYLYPSALAFVLNRNNELKILLRNIHPHHEPEAKSCTQYTLRAILDLIKEHQPNLWASIERNIKHIYTLEDLHNVIQPNLFLKKLGRLTWTVFIYLVLLFMLSLPIAAYGPTQISEPLKKLYYPVLLSV